MEQSGGVGEVAAKGAKTSSDDARSGGEDRFSALHDDFLVLILLRLDPEDAARTSLLSRRWCRVWTLLPELRFGVARDPPRLLRDALSASDVPLRYLLVRDPNASPQSLAAWLPAAARRVSGELCLVKWSERRATGAEASQRGGGTVELPCFDKATVICLDLGFLGLSLPPAGVFARLTNLYLRDIRFHGPGQLGDAVSSPRCPCLQALTLRHCHLHFQGLESITIHSESLQRLEFKNLRGVRQITVVAPALMELHVFDCFITDKNHPVVNITAPQLKSLEWVDPYDPGSVHLGRMEHLQSLCSIFFVYGKHGMMRNRACLMLLPQFKAIKHLILSLGYLPEINNNLQYLMEDMTMLPDVTFLELIVLAEWHAFGASSFHVLRICSRIKRLHLVLPSRVTLEEQTACSSGCICDQSTNWKTEGLSLNHLQDLKIDGFGALEHEVAFVKRLLNWVSVLKMMTVTFSHAITEIKAKEMFQMFHSFSQPGLCMKFYIYQESSKVLYAPKD